MTTLEIIPPIIAHRGASAYAPENTMIAFIKAAQLGVKWVEFDVTLAASGEPIIFHDESLERTTNGKGQVVAYPYTYLSSLDAGAWFSPKYSGERIPLLSEVLTFLAQTNLSANIEIKISKDREEQLIKRLVKDLMPILPSASILFSSFSLSALQCVRDYLPDCLLGVLLDEWHAGWQQHCSDLDCVSIHVAEDIVSVEKVTEIKAMNKKLLCYTVNDPIRAQVLFDLGVDAIFTDVPDRMLALRQI